MASYSWSGVIQVSEGLNGSEDVIYSLVPAKILPVAAKLTALAHHFDCVSRAWRTYTNQHFVDYKTNILYSLKSAVCFSLKINFGRIIWKSDISKKSRTENSPSLKTDRAPSPPCFHQIWLMLIVLVGICIIIIFTDAL